MKLVACLRGSYKSTDATRKLGCCPDSHYLLMVLRALEAELMKVGVQTVQTKFLDENKKQQDPFFRRLDSTMLPVLVVVSDNDEIEEEFQEMADAVEYLEKLTKLALMSRDARLNDEVRKFTPFAKMVLWFKSPEKSEKIYEKELQHINSLLGEKHGAFLEGDDATVNDYRILAKLYHTETATQSVKGYVIPDELTRLKTFMKRGKELAVFKATCPDCEEICVKWEAFKKQRTSK